MQSLHNNQCIAFQEAYALLNKYEVPVTREEMDKVDTMRYTFEKLLQDAVQDQL